MKLRELSDLARAWSNKFRSTRDPNDANRAIELFEHVEMMRMLGMTWDDEVDKTSQHLLRLPDFTTN